MRSRIAVATVAMAGFCIFFDAPRLKHVLADDQTLFLRGAELLRHGGLLYREFWDVKPPGIFLLYLAGGSIFGFTDLGMRLMEMAILTGFAVLSFLWLGPRIGYRAAWLGAVLLIPFYNSLSVDPDLGTVEGLACLPVAIAAFGLLSPRSSRRLVAAGASVGFLLLLKLFYGLVAAGFWTIFLIMDRESARRFRTWAILVASAALPIAATVAWFTARGVFPDLISAVFKVPYEARNAIDPMMRIGALTGGVHHFLSGTAALGLLLLPAAWATWEKRHERRIWMPLAFLCAWIVTGAVAIMVQFQSWWEYHWLLILPPVALLAGFGLDWALTQVVHSSAVRRSIAGLILALAAFRAIGVARNFAEDMLTDREVAENRLYRDIRRDEARQVQCGPSDTAFIWMSPMTPRFSNCRLASAIEGDNMTVLPASVYQRARADIVNSSPRYIYVSNRDLVRKAPWPNFESKFPGVLARYEVVYHGLWGTWFQRRR
jgi:hypothetical protein